MIQNVDDAVKFLEFNNLEYWRVKVKDSDNAYIFESDETKTFSDNVSNFRRVMDICTGSRFFLQAAPKKGVARGNFYEEFKNISGNSTILEKSDTPQVQGVPLDEVERRISAAIEGLKTQQRLESLELENKELKQDIKDMQTPINRMITKVEPYIGTILAQIVKKVIPSAPAIQMAGIVDESQNNDQDADFTQSEQENNQNSSSDNEIRLVNALQKWEQADPDFIDLIEVVANLASTQDPRYTWAKNMLK